MSLALGHREIETELCRLDADLRRKSGRANLIEEPHVMIANRYRPLGAGDGFAELGEKDPAPSGGDGGTCCEPGLRALARHEPSRCALHGLAVQCEIVEPSTSRSREQDRTSRAHCRSFPQAEVLLSSCSADDRERTPT